MINIMDENFSDYQLQELERASKNLPNKIVVRCEDVGTGVSSLDKMNTCFFPHNIEKGITSKDMYILDNSTTTNWGYLTERNRFSKKETYNIDFSRLPKIFTQVDVYRFDIFQENSIDFLVAELLNNDINVLWGYSSNSFDDLYNNVFVGSFAKTDSGFWKFYPKMQKIILSKEEIYYKYKHQ